MGVPDLCTTFRFSTAGLPVAARARAVRELHNRERPLLPAGGEPLEPLPDLPVHVAVTKRTLPVLSIVSGTFGGLRHGIRPCNAVANGADDLLIGVNVRGCSTALQREREQLLRDGDGIIATRGETGLSLVRPTPARFLGCRMSRQAVAALLGRLDDQPMSLVPHDTEALSLLITYACAITDDLPLATPELQRLAVSHMHDLMAATISATSDRRAVAEGHGIAAA